MIFNSIEFSIFLPIIFTIYWVLQKKSYRNITLLIASYVFYGLWDWRFLSLILFSTLMDYTIGILIFKEQNKVKKKLLLWTSIIINLGFLCYFKYFNFFIESFASAFSFLGQEINASRLNIVLPVGISFYTFQTMSYSIDIYKKKLKPTKNFIAFAAFVSFFPQLVAGPIERATNLLPQFEKKHTFNYSQSIDGLKQILWGLFKKIIIADNCAQYANLMFDNVDSYSGSSLVLGAVFFSFQIYGDFSGYSDIAIGTSRLFGFNLIKNFSFPYFSRDISEFWRRWHISLSTWFRDYLYIPLGGSKGSNNTKIRNVFLIFIVSGFWHGANWTFIFWGTLNAVFFIPLLLTNKNRDHIEIVAKNKNLPSIPEFLQIISTYILICFTWVFFRANNLQQAFIYIKQIFTKSLFKTPVQFPIKTSVFLLIFILFEWYGRRNEYALEKIMSKWNRTLRLTIYYIIILSILCFGGKKQQFIYFQF